MPDRRALVQDGDVGSFQLLDDGAGAVACSLDDANAFFDYDACVGAVVGGAPGPGEG